MFSTSVDEEEVLDQLSDQALESQFLAGLTNTFPSISAYFGYDTANMDLDNDQANGEERAKRELKERRLKERERQAELERQEHQRAVDKLAETRKNNLVKLDFKEKDRLSNGANYDVWSIRMRGFLMEAGL